MYLLSQSGSVLNLDNSIQEQALDVKEIYIFRKDVMNREMPVVQADPKDFRQS